jgi:hypothetical protein
LRKRVQVYQTLEEDPGHAHLGAEGCRIRRHCCEPMEVPQTSQWKSSP